MSFQTHLALVDEKKHPMNMPPETLPYATNKPESTVVENLEPTAKISGGDDVVTAAQALTQLTRSASPSPNEISSCASTLGSPISSPSPLEFRQQQHPIVQGVSAVSKHPIVTNAVRYYETSKRNYATFNYAAGIVEKAAMPVFNKIEVNLNNIHQARLEQRRRKKKRKVSLPKDKVEIKKRLKFCLHILKLANDNISSNVVDLQLKINHRDLESTEKHELQLATPRIEDKQQENCMSDQEAHKAYGGAPNVAFQLREQAGTRKEVLKTKTEIITTVKKIIHVISNFKPSALSTLNKFTDELNDKETEDTKLKVTIREIILNLLHQVQQGAQALQTNEKIVFFANESLEMINKLTSVFNEQLERAENWVDGEGPEIAFRKLPSSDSVDSLETKV